MVQKTGSQMLIVLQHILVIAQTNPEKKHKGINAFIVEKILPVLHLDHMKIKWECEVPIHIL